MGVASRATAGLLWLLVLAAGVTSTPDSSPAPQTMSSTEQLSSTEQPPASEQLSAAEQLSQLVEASVQRVLERRAAAADSSQLEQLQHRLDLLELRAAAGQCQAPWKPVRSELVGGACEEKSEMQHDLKTVQEADPEPTEQPEPEPEPELESPPECDQSPSPLSAYQAPHQRPEKLACARSCLQLRDQGGAPQDGVYWFTGMPVPVLCDFSHDGGGWTLLLTAKSRDGWNLLSVRGRRERSPSLDDNYSILRHADTIRDLGNGTRFAYRIETQAEKGRQRWGGVWVAPRHYSFMAEYPDQTEVICVRKFDKWVYKSTGINKRMPWLHMLNADVGNSPTVLTTNKPGYTWGILLYDEGTTNYQHSPWSHKDATNSGKVLYWMREEFL
ncbi:hypothetical protein FJT64_010775 [Amphibalanus amphitrite]|uniref:Fibrinogen C-terminal domain-containing protein n=1 Tax=Amphibalanus amphitrite TaxID=1232801 RepID=A0A6A4VBA5_AMPAM|nr:hypothetical protein FJT64_010775 [Amphibalanus amphitrite]